MTAFEKLFKPEALINIRTEPFSEQLFLDSFTPENRHLLPQANVFTLKKSDLLEAALTNTTVPVEELKKTSGSNASYTSF